MSIDFAQSLGVNCHILDGEIESRRKATTLSCLSKVHNFIGLGQHEFQDEWRHGQPERSKVSPLLLQLLVGDHAVAVYPVFFQVVAKARVVRLEEEVEVLEHAFVATRV